MNWEQLRTLLWLRWRLTRNQWSRGGRLGIAIGIFVSIASLTIGLGGGLGGLLGGLFGLKNASPMVLMFLWDLLIGVFCFFWLMGVVMEIQRSETIDLTRLLHLPVSLRQVFVLNYAASHLTPGIFIALPGMLGLALGLAIGREWRMVLMLPMVVSFLFLVTSWTYCLRGWLMVLMSNPRRRRAIVVGLTLVLVLVGQLPNLVFNVALRPNRQPGMVEGQPHPSRRQQMQRRVDQLVPAMEMAHVALPVLWPALGARTLAEGRISPALIGTAGALLLAGLGIRRAYVATLGFYRGREEGKNKPLPKAARTRDAAPASRTWIDRDLPWMPGNSGALTLATFRSMTRAPEVQMALVMNVVVVLIMAAVVFGRGAMRLQPPFSPLLISGAIGFTLVGMVQLLFNQFGFDRDGFRALILLPIKRRHILLGKNAALLPLSASLAAIMVSLAVILTRSSPVALAAGLFQFVTGFALMATAGNLASMMVPFRVAPGSLKPTKVKGTTMALFFVFNMLFPVAMIPVFLPAGLGALCAHLNWLPAAPVNLLLSIVMAAVAVATYFLLLPPLGRLLERREKKILQIVTAEVE